MAIRVPSGGETIDLADWVEAFMIVNKPKRISRSRMRRELKELVPIDADDLELMIELVDMEIERRARVVGRTYPFSVESDFVKLALDENSLAYVFLLCIATSEGARSESGLQQVESLLDLVVCDALSGYLSGQSRAIRFGWPVSGDRPPSFPDAVKWLAAQLGLPTSVGRRRPHSKDAGVDVVAWRPFRDARHGFVTILAQCTSAINWPAKARDIEIDIWRGYIDFGKDPTICLAVPFVIPDPFDKWDELRRTVHFVLDRLRICELLNDVHLTAYDRVEEWTCSELRSMGQV